MCMLTKTILSPSNKKITYCNSICCPMYGRIISIKTNIIDKENVKT